jgi:hypothetical protein
MSKKSSSFKRKLKARKFGFRYYRIWGNALEDYNVAYHQEKCDANKCVIKFSDTFITLYTEARFVGMDDSPKWVGGKFVQSLVPYSKSLRDRYSNSLDGSLLLGCYFKTLAQAQRELALYASGCKTEGLQDLILYHKEMDDFDAMMRFDHDDH